MEWGTTRFLIHSVFLLLYFCENNDTAREFEQFPQTFLHQIQKKNA